MLIYLECRRASGTSVGSQWPVIKVNGKLQQSSTDWSASGPDP